MEKLQNPKEFTLSRQNYIGLTIFGLILALAFAGGPFHQKWAENLYTFISVAITIIFIGAALLATRMNPIKQFFAAYFLNVLYCAAIGWWWLCLFWTVNVFIAGYLISQYITAYEKQEGITKDEDKG